MKLWPSPILRPLPAEGFYFHRRRFKTFEHAPHPSRTTAYGASWYSMDDTKGARPSCHVVAEMDKDRRLHIVECFHATTTTQEAVKWQFKIDQGMHRSAVEATAYPKKAGIYGVMTWFCCREQFSQGVSETVFQEEERLRKDAQPHQLPISALPSNFDLASSARILQSEILAGRILLPPSDPWMRDFLLELCQWPTVRTDARVRSMCVLISALPGMMPPVQSAPITSGKGSHWAA